MIVGVVFLVVITVLISIMVVVPMVIVLQPASIAVPVTRIILLSVMARFHPAGAGVGGTCPVAFMPLVVMADRIPVAAYPREFRAWARRHNADDAGTRWRANPDAK